MAAGRLCLVANSPTMSISCSLVHEDGVPRMLAPGHPDLRVLFVPKGRYAILDTGMSGPTRLRESRRCRGRRVRAR